MQVSSSPCFCEKQGDYTFMEHATVTQTVQNIKKGGYGCPEQFSALML